MRSKAEAVRGDLLRQIAIGMFATYTFTNSIGREDDLKYSLGEILPNEKPPTALLDELFKETVFEVWK